MKTLVVFPDGLGAELKRVIPARQRSAFVAAAVADRLKRHRLDAFLARKEPAWSDRNHPDLTTQAGVNRYLARFRGRVGRPG